MEEVWTIRPLEWFTADEIRAAFSDNRGKHMQALWDSLSPDEVRKKMEKNFLDPEVQKRAQEGVKATWKKKTPEEIEAHVRSSFLSPEAIKKSGEGYSRYWASLPEEDKESFRESHRQLSLDFYDSSEGELAKQVLSEIGRESWASKTEEERKEWLAKSCHSKEAREAAGPHISEGLFNYWMFVTDEERQLRLQSWLDSDAILNIVKSNKRGKTQPESMLQFYLDKNFPGVWLYNGDGSQNVVIGRCIPDFVRADGLKAVLEVFGGYWHQLGDEDEKIKHYGECSTKCLVFWDYECYFEKDVVERLEAFNSVLESELLEENTSEPGKLPKEVVHPL